MKRAIAVFVATGAVAFGGMSAVSAAVNDEGRESDAMASVRVAATGVDARLSRSLSAFARPQRTSDALSADAKRTIAATTSLGVNTALSRKVMTADDGRDYFLVAGNNSISLVNDAGVGMTDDIDRAMSGNTIGFQDCVGKNGARIVGILPADATDPKIVDDSGTEHPLSVASGAYVHLFEKVAGSIPSYVSFVTGGETKRVTAPVPADVLTTRCVDPTIQPGEQP